MASTSLPLTSAARRAMVVHLGEAQVFERHGAQTVQRAVHIHRALAHLLEQSPELLLVHTARITAWDERPIVRKTDQKINFMPSCRMRGLCAPPPRRSFLLS